MTTRKTNTITFPIVLKTLHNDIVTSQPASTLTTKQMRVTLRAKAGDIHAKNSSWTFTTQSDYDRVRSLFDPAYAEKLAKSAKRATKPATTTRAKKVKASTEIVETQPENVDA